MTRPYSVDLRERVVRAVETGLSRRAAARRFEVSVSFVIKLMQRWRRAATVEPDRYGGWKRPALAAHAERVHNLLRDEPDLTIAELRSRLAAEAIHVSPAAISRFLTAAGLTKKKTHHAAEQERPDIAAARAVWRARQADLSPERLVFIDETWATTHMARRHGRARRGQRLVAAVPHGHWKTTTFLAALRHDRLTAPCVFDGAINGERFCAWVEQALAPTLAQGDLVIMDNLGAHKVQGVREAIEARGAQLLYLPPYSPDLNPIEQVFAKLKALLRTAATRTVDALWHAIGQALDAFSPAECAHYLAHAGYVPSNR
ncbi:MAG TPA: IS630 family transposase [Roseiflexaceae bacterium]|nr:IS630 family transposase [Roseiflexaceae bacterium]